MKFTLFSTFLCLSSSPLLFNSKKQNPPHYLAVGDFRSLAPAVLRKQKPDRISFSKVPLSVFRQSSASVILCLRYIDRSSKDRSVFCNPTSTDGEAEL